MTFDVMQLSAETLKRLMPGQESRVVWQEFKNKLQAFDLFENVDAALNLSAQSSIPLSSLVEKAYALDTYRAIWATEGLGHYHAERCWERTGIPRKLLRDDNAAALPAKSLTALHAGMGLSLSNRLLRTVGAQSSESEIRNVLQQFVELCKDNSMPGYVGAVYESLGLVTRNLYPQLVWNIDRQLQKINEKLVGYFWHGLGRATYFAPTNFLPFNSSPWRALEMVRREPTHETGRLNALAGLVWAMVLVNIRQPEILEALLRCHQTELSRSDALSNGVSSAIMIWRDLTDDNSYLDALYQHQPQSSEPALVELWTNQVLRPCRNTLQRFYPAIKDHNCLGEVFRYQSLPDLVAMLEKEQTYKHEPPLQDSESRGL